DGGSLRIRADERIGITRFSGAGSRLIIHENHCPTSVQPDRGTPPSTQLHIAMHVLVAKYDASGRKGDEGIPALFGWDPTRRPGLRFPRGERSANNLSAKDGVGATAQRFVIARDRRRRRHPGSQAEITLACTCRAGPAQSFAPHRTNAVLLEPPGARIADV